MLQSLVLYREKRKRTKSFYPMLLKRLIRLIPLQLDFFSAITHEWIKNNMLHSYIQKLEQILVVIEGLSERLEHLRCLNY